MTAPAPLDRAAIRNAIVAWVAGATGVGATKVLWAGQDAGQPAYPFVELGVPRMLPGLGTASISEAYDEDALEPEPGEVGTEMVITAKSDREFMVPVDVYSQSADWALDASALLDRLRGSAGLEEHRAVLAVGGVVLVDMQGEAVLDQIAGAKFTQRRHVDVRFRAAASVVERATYIEALELSAPDLGIPDNDPIVVQVEQE